MEEVGGKKREGGSEYESECEYAENMEYKVLTISLLLLNYLPVNYKLFERHRHFDFIFK